MAEILTILVQLALVAVALGVLAAMIAEAAESRWPSVGRRRLGIRSTMAATEADGRSTTAVAARSRHRVA